MRFSTAENDAALAGAVADLLAKEAGPEEIRAGWPGGRSERVDAVWRKLAGVGVAGTLVPEADDGLGLDENALPPLLTELGRSGLPVPAAETVAVGAPLLAAAGAPQLAGVLAGDLLLTASADAGAPVPFGTRADLFVLRTGEQLRLYGCDEVDAEPVGSADGSRALARVTAPPGGGLLLAEGPDAVAAAWRHGVLGTAALLVGLGERMVELTVAYVAERHQFGVPVGSFQAVKHALADAELAVRFARPAVMAAGWAQAAGDPGAAVRTSMAKVLASDAARLAARTAIQCHGAIGYTTEYDLHLYAKRAWALAAAWGGPSDHRELIARELDLTRVGRA
ncbi:acyl-CoA dehydrogenase family protein [Streptomyces thermolineatus]|uniref:acyl-CoA dehydrogenase family protein n=1 Tax=Streptomyces thermolineatus TaxID=44033 RepID=UPI00384AA5C9